MTQCKKPETSALYSVSGKDMLFQKHEILPVGFNFNYYMKMIFNDLILKPVLEMLASISSSRFWSNF